MRPSTLPVAISLALTLSACQLLPFGNGDDSRSPPPIPRGAGQTGSFAPTLEGQQCLAKLGATGADFSPLPNRFDAPGCTQINAVALTGLQGDASRFSVTNLPAVTCDTANVFGGWVRFGVDRAARRYLGSPLARVETMGSYSCRNVAGTNRRSAHARGEAIDIAAFVLEDGLRVSVLGDWNGGTTAEREFLRVVRESACKRFGTVLSPDYNAAHADHFHLETGGGSFCR